MKKSRAIGDLLKELFTEPSSVRKLLYNHVRERSAQKRVRKHYGIDAIPYIELMDLLPEEGETLHHYTFLNGNSRVSDIALIKSLCRRPEECDFLEIGTWRGETIRNVADVARSCTSISLPDEDVRKARGNRVAGMQRMFSAGVENIEHIHHDSKTFDIESLDRKFDVIFIDGEHSYEGVLADTRNAFRVLKDEHSVIVWHDFARGFEHLRFEVLEAALDGSPSASHREHIFRVSNTLCGVYMPDPPATKDLKPPHTPTSSFDISLKATDRH